MNQITSNAASQTVNSSVRKTANSIATIVNYFLKTITLNIHLIFTLLVLFIYNLFFFNKFFPLTEGWFSVYTELMSRGSVPYRDFYFYLPPLYPMLLKPVWILSGGSFLALRIFGIAIILLMATALFSILKQIFSPTSALIATIVAIIYYQSGVAHITYDFTQILTLFALTATYFIIKYIDVSCTAAFDGGIFLFSAGIFASMSFLTKQSNGFFVVIFLGLSVIFMNSLQPKQVFHRLCWYCIGVALPMLAMVLYLFCHGALGLGIAQVFRGASHAKGSSKAIIYGWMPGLMNTVYLRQSLTIFEYLAPFFSANLILFIFFKKINIDNNIRKYFYLSISIAAFLLSVILPYFQQNSMSVFAECGSTFINYIIVISTLTTLFSLITGLVIRKWQPDISKKLLLCSLFSIGYVFGNGTSAGLSEVGCFFGFAIFLAFTFSLRFDFGITRIVLLASSSLFLIFLVQRKYDHPYAWWGISEPNIRTCHSISQQPALSGMRLSRQSVDIVDTIVKILLKEPKETASLFCFPHIPQFYLFTDRFPVTKAKVHWFDFLPDEGAIADALVLKKHLPTQLVIVNLPEIAWSAHERLFRHGQPLGQRKILAILDELRSSGKYDLYWKCPLENSCSIEVWEMNKASLAASASNPSSSAIMRTEINP